jgi:hypothetical protein
MVTGLGQEPKIVFLIQNAAATKTNRLSHPCRLSWVTILHIAVRLW